MRKARLSDIPALIGCCQTSIIHACVDDYTRPQIEAWAKAVNNPKRWEKAIEQQYFIVAEQKSELMGFGSIEQGEYLDFLYVHPAHLRKGIASKIYALLEQEARSLRKEVIWSDVSKTAVPFFQKQGFTIEQEQRNFIDKVEIINFKMKKNLLY